MRWDSRRQAGIGVKAGWEGADWGCVGGWNVVLVETVENTIQKEGLTF